MKVMKTLVLGLGIAFVCGCGKKVSANVWNPVRTTAGTYLGNKANPATYTQGQYTTQANQHAAPQGQNWAKPGQGYYR